MKQGEPASGAGADPAVERVARQFQHQQAREPLIRRWLAALELQAGDVVVDLGCGPGLPVLMAARQVGPGGRVFAVDRSPEALAFLRAREQEWRDGGITLAPIVTMQAEAREVSLPEPASAAMITHMLHHNEDPLGVLARARRLLDPAGRAVVAEFEPSAPGAIGPAVAERISLQTLAGWLQAAGFDLVRTVVRGEQEQYAVLVRPRPERPALTHGQGAEVAG